MQPLLVAAACPPRPPVSAVRASDRVRIVKMAAEKPAAPADKVGETTP